MGKFSLCVSCVQITGKLKEGESIIWFVGIERIEKEERSGGGATVPTCTVHMREAEDWRLGL
jgi:hypothetical protein